MKKEQFRGLQSSVGISVVALIVMVGIFTSINNKFFSAENFETLLQSISPMLIMAVGATPIILLGSTDLSIGAVVSLATVIFAKFVPDRGLWIYIVVLGIGALSGLLIGILNASMKVPSFIASLAFMSIWSSIALILTDSGGPIAFSKPYWWTITWARTNFGWLPAPFIPAFLLFVFVWFLLEKTILGKRIYAIGANERAARLAGIPCERTKVFVFMFAGLLYAFAGILYLAKILSGNPSIGDDFTLLTIASIALGGVSLAGGKGSIFGALLGTVLASIITNGLTIIGVDSWWQKVVFGGVIIVTAYLTSGKQNRSITVK